MSSNRKTDRKMCLVHNCNNKGLFAMPANNEKRAIWLKLVGRNDSSELPFSIMRNYRICSDHFLTSAFTTDEKKKLNRNAIPYPHSTLSKPLQVEYITTVQNCEITSTNPMIEDMNKTIKVNTQRTFEPNHPNTSEQCKICFRLTTCYNVFRYQYKGTKGSDLFYHFTGQKLKGDNQLLFCETCMQDFIKSYNFREKCKKLSKLYFEENSQTTNYMSQLTNTSINSEPSEILEPPSPPEPPELEELESPEIDRNCEIIRCYAKPSNSWNTEKTRITNETSDKNSNITLEGSDTIITVNEEKSLKRVSNSTVCYICGWVSSRPQYLQTHINSHIRPFSCEICDKKCSSKQTLQKHLVVHTSRRPYQCNICKKNFKSKCSVMTHKRVHTDHRPFKCIVCDKTFKNRPTLKSHMMCHSQERPYKCEICEKEFSKNLFLQAHIKRHRNEYDFLCNVCGKTYLTDKLLKQHMANKHSGIVKSVEYTCEYCGKTLKSLTTWQYHVRLHTGEKPFKCELCEQSFGGKLQLRIHTRFHTNENLVRCDYCDKRFLNRYKKIIHERIHTGEKPFRCDLCGRECRMKSQLSKHLKRCKKKIQ